MELDIRIDDEHQSVDVHLDATQCVAVHKFPPKDDRPGFTTLSVQGVKPYRKVTFYLTHEQTDALCERLLPGNLERTQVDRIPNSLL